MEARELPQSNAPEVATSRAPPNAPDADGRAQGFGQLRLNLEALCKRKGVPSYSGDAYQLLKERKYIATNE